MRINLKISSVVFILFAVSAFSFVSFQETEYLNYPQWKDYEQQWQKVDSLKKKGLNKTAFIEIEKIYAQSKKEKNAPQIVKALINRVGVLSLYEEEAEEKSIEFIQNELKQVDYPAKAILHSILADLYWQYYQNNRHRIFERSSAEFENDDLRTWDLTKLHQTITKHYDLSLFNSDSLKRTKLNIFDPVLIKGDTVAKKHRPSLYDFLAYRALDFYAHEESGISLPSWHFQLEDPAAFSTYEKFIEYTFETKDTGSIKLKALNLFQDILNFHKNDKNPEALIEADVKRLQFAHNNASIQTKDSLYLKGLENLNSKFSHHPASAEIAYEIALFYFNNGNKYEPYSKTIYKWDKQKAFNLCEETIKKFPDSFGTKQCKYLQAKIKEKFLSLNLEKAVSVNTPFPALLTYKNIEKVYARIVLVPNVNSSIHSYDNRAIITKEILKYETVKQWAVETPLDKDYQQHSAEIALPELPSGKYCILISNSENFDFDKSAVAYAFVWSTDISHVERRTNQGEFEIVVTDRKSGSPIRNATVKSWLEKYDYKTRKYYREESGKYITDENGFITIPKRKEYQRFYLEIINGKDRVFSDNSLYQYHSSHQQNKKRLKTWFFTDRSIYRPGQTIYFKGIIIETEGESNLVKAKHSTTTLLFDANHQKVSEINLVSNDYGSFSGSFTLPAGGLTGNMHIKNESGAFFFSVEEYKRPKFEVVFQPLKGTFKPGDKVKSAAIAKTYSGAAIDGAQVRYRVVRNPSYPRFWHHGSYPQVQKMEIAQGVTQTNQQGVFEIEFKALPGDEHFSDSPPLYYNFTVYADVTDISGETRSAEKTIPVGYTSLIINADVPSLINKNDPTEITFKTTNLEGRPEPAKVTLSISRLENPERVLRERLWNRPDKFILSEKAFTAIFPNDIYDDENNLENRKIAEFIQKSTINTASESQLKLNKIKEWKTGAYLIEATAIDSTGNEVKEKIYFTVFSDREKEPAIHKPLFFEAIKSKAEPGQNAVFLIGSRQAVNVLFEIEHDKKIVKREWHSLKNEQKTIEIPVEEKHRGNFSVHVVAVKNNRNYYFGNSITVPYSNKELHAEFETFRDKLQPGQKEEWTIKIKGNKGDKIAAEMVASLYDASLDAFKPHQWNFNIYTSFYPSLGWQNNLSFGVVSTNLYSLNWNYFPDFPLKNHDQLNWFVYPIYTRNQHFRAASSMNSMAGVRKAESEIAVTEDDSETSGNISKEKENSKDDHNGQITEEVKIEKGKLGEDAAIKIRSDFNETAFFYPHLNTDENGAVIIKFTLPESITRWKLLGFVHTHDLKFGHFQKELLAQKELMVSPVLPRFFRDGDEIYLSASIINLTSQQLTGKAKLEIIDPLSLKKVGNIIAIPDIDFTVSGEKSATIKWKTNIPEGLQTVLVRVSAKAGAFTDGEEIVIPVLSNRILITESLPLPIRGNQKKEFSFEKLLNQKSTTLKSHKLSLEFTANPVWYAVQALPYLMEFPYDCSEQVFSKYYANAIASHIANSNPKIKAVFEQWKSQNPDAFLSALEKNAELKNVLLEETPWVLQSINEQERKKRISLLFDLNKMSGELTSSEQKLIKMQTPNGGFPWFPGMKDDRFISQYIVTGFGRLNNLGVKTNSENKKLTASIKKAIYYLDDRIKEDYEQLIANKSDTAKKQITPLQIQYFYARSYYNDYPLNAKNSESYKYFYTQMKKFWNTESRYIQAMSALAMYRYKESKVPEEIIKSIKDNALYSEEMGMYWKDNVSGYYWHQAPVESQALFIEAFDEITNDEKAVEEMKIWLLKQKQTQEWKSTKATSEACYALLLRGSNLLESESQINISIGKQNFNYDEINNKEAGTGYFKTSWNESEITPDMGRISIDKKSNGVSWGAVYWQYFEQLDKITSHQSPLTLNKKLFLETYSDGGVKIIPIKNSTALKPGDRVIVRIELKTDRVMEYVHLKDLRASGMEPENVLSQYKYKDGLGYYESTRDAATNFFFSYLPKGTFVFEYPLRITHFGDFSTGLAILQSMYSPEFTSHSEGLRITVKEKK
ncbi:MAG: MG2 domain-containing protein [Bacteroidota bacterium]|nr:MG2 domain-containing protein [Bacteroidota bacterium]